MTHTTTLCLDVFLQRVYQVLLCSIHLKDKFGLTFSSCNGIFDLLANVCASVLHLLFTWAKHVLHCHAYLLVVFL